jgi:predicted nucleotidyltransferase
MTEASAIKFGLTEKQYKLIEDAIISFDEIEKVIIFGSRAGDNFKPSSDIDLAIAGKSVSSRTVNRFSSHLEELPLPFMFDILDYNAISNNSLKTKIETQGKIFFDRKLRTA